MITSTRAIEAGRKLRTSLEQRHLAREMRSVWRNGGTITAAAANHNVSRNHCYRLAAALEAWETDATVEEVMEELEDLMVRKGNPVFAQCGRQIQCDYAPGRMILDYIQGREPDIGRAIQRKRDPLLD